MALRLGMKLLLIGGGLHLFALFLNMLFGVTFHQRMH
ncbi:hypothetical protein MCACP_22190 [Neomoorella carbonis]